MLSARRLGLRYGKTWALRECTFDLPRGSVTALVGPNGAGKTTLMNLVMGFLAPTEGAVTVAGAPPRERRGAASSRVSYVAQDKPLYRFLTADETMRFGQRMNVAWDDAAARSWLDRFDVPRDRRCGSLSGGQRAHVAIALALGARPDLVLLDEPLANLDPLVRTDVVRGILDIVRSSAMTVLLSTHVVAELHGVADHLVLLDDGTLVLDGAVAPLLASHGYLVGPPGADPPAGADVVHVRTAPEGTRVLVRTGGAVAAGGAWSWQPAPIDELILDYLRAPRERAARAAS